MLRLKYNHLCDYAFLTHGNKLSMIGIFDHMWSKDFPFNANPFHIVAIFESDKDTQTEIEIQIVNTEDKVVFKQKGKFNVRAQGDVRLIMGINNFKFDEPGNYIVRFIEKGNEIARLDLPVLQRTQPSPPFAGGSKPS